MTPPSPLRDPNGTPLARKIATRLACDGPISVHDYIEACLYDSECGYYRTKAAIGQGGDFVTAPEISQVFGELIGLWAGEVWRYMGEPAPIRLVELGPGRGTLMADAIRALKVVPGFLSGATVHLVETSKTLQDSQRAALAQAPVRISWHDEFEDVPDGPAILIANEFFDCLPVQQFVFDGSGGSWRERVVGLDGDGFRLAAGAIVEAPPEFDAAAAIEIEDGAILERRPAVGGIIDAFAARSPLAALIIDYGYSRLSIGDTVQAVKSHRFAGLFHAPGESDVTAHVDFLQLKQAAKRAKMKTFGPMPMGEWLLRLGLEARVRQLLGHSSEEEANEMRGRVARLVDPAQMGAVFKVLALTNGIAMPPPPFD
jgi:NADH dehydrogenase [ubiquinone] 1 alpha subcomplex assembly factor 7